MNQSIRICAGIVTFNPQKKITTNCVKVLIPQVEKIFIFDNGSNDKNILESLRTLSDKVEITYNNQNIGIAAALNVLCRIAKKKGYGWILTMDQDSICDELMVSYLSAYKDRDNYGIVAPRVEFWNDGNFITSTKWSEKETYEEQACITSGSLTRISAWEKIGGFDEWMFIDHVDNEFCVHLLDEGYKVLRVNSAILYQRAGEMRYKIKRDGSIILLPYYSPLRQYFISRNTVYYLRKYHKSYNVNLIHESCAFLYTLYIKLLYENNRWKTIKSSFRGIVDGFKKKIVYINYSK